MLYCPDCVKTWKERNGAEYDEQYKDPPHLFSGGISGADELIKEAQVIARIDRILCGGKSEITAILQASTYVKEEWPNENNFSQPYPVYGRREYLDKPIGAVR